MEGTIAQVMMFAGTFAPRSWSFCQGQLLAISTNQALFSVIGTTYGGNGQTTFALPDLRGRAPIGHGTGPGLTNRTIGETGGSETVTLGVAEMPSHSHTAQSSGGSLTVQSAAANQSSPGPNSYIGVPRSTGGVNTQVYTDSSDSPVQINGGGAGDVTVGDTGGNTPHTNMQPFLAIPYVICLTGQYPARD